MTRFIGMARMLMIHIYMEEKSFKKHFIKVFIKKKPSKLMRNKHLLKHEWQKICKCNKI